MQCVYKEETYENEKEQRRRRGGGEREEEKQIVYIWLSREFTDLRGKNFKTRNI